MKKILLLNQSIGTGGAERQICGLAIGLKRQGYNVRLVTPRKKDFYSLELQELGDSYELHPELISPAMRIVRLIKLIRKFRPDTIISYGYSMNLPACIAKIFYPKAQLIVSERNTTQILTRNLKILYALYRLADYIVPNSHSQSKYLSDRYPKYKYKIRTITNFVHVDRFVPAEEKIENDVLEIVTVARYSIQKNGHRYIDAIRRVVAECKNVHFSWYGDKSSGGEYYQQMEAAIKEYNLSGYVTLNNATDNVVKVYQSADIFVLPSLFEGYPNVVCEAMCCELPIICGDVCDNATIVEDGVNGILCDPKSVDSIANAIINMVKMNRVDRLKMGKRNRAKLIDSHSIENFVNKYKNLIK